MIIFSMTESEEMLFKESGLRPQFTSLRVGNVIENKLFWAVDGDDLLYSSGSDRRLPRWNITFRASPSDTQDSNYSTDIANVQRFFGISSGASSSYGDSLDGQPMPDANELWRIPVLRIFLNTRIDVSKVIPGLQSLGYKMNGADWKVQRNFLTEGVQFQKCGESATAEQFVKDCSDAWFGVNS